MITFNVLIIIFLLYILYNYYNRCDDYYEYYDDDFTIKESKIHGNGVFSLKNFLKGSMLFKTIENNQKITFLGSKINHCQLEKTNTYIEKTEDGWILFASKDINKDDELLADYNNTPSFIKKPDKNWSC